MVVEVVPLLEVKATTFKAALENLQESLRLRILEFVDFILVCFRDTVPQISSC